MTAVRPTPASAPPTLIDQRRGAATAYVGYGLLLFGLFTGGISAFVAMILAYDRKSQSAPLPATHFAFQIRIFWICFALSLAGGALWLGGALDLLLHQPLPRPVIPGEPDAQMVRLAGRWLWPSSIETWSYNFELHPFRPSRAASLKMWGGGALFVAAVLISWAGPIFGIARLAAGRPIGHAPDPIVEAAP